MGNARAVLGLGGDGDQHRFENGVGLGGSARHEARTPERTFFAAGDAHADEIPEFVVAFSGATFGVVEKGIAAVDDDVAFVEQWANSAITASTGAPALTMTMMRRGRSSA